MIKEMDIRCHLYGESFSPMKIEKSTGITLENKIEVGDIVSKGRCKGELSSYGNGELCPQDEYKNSEDYGLLWIVETLQKYIDVFRSYGAKDIDLVIGVFYEGQCNFVLEPKAIKVIGELGIPLQVSCYESY
ncbi:hypothetical protein [Peribacillus sp. Hz7]|uniref:hypothetical protein n=1 Tax=Peribacillus sp. Hz7 TaxID=3344873 RepID=UPI0035CB091A